MLYQISKNKNKKLYFLSAITLLFSLTCNFLLPDKKITNVPDDFIIVGGWSSNDQTQVGLYLINLHSRAIRQITEDIDNGGFDLFFAVSPDCKKVLYRTLKGSFLLHLETGETISLSNISDQSWASYWSPSGRYIASKSLGNFPNPNSFYRILDLELNQVVAEIPVKHLSDHFGWLNNKEILISPYDGKGINDLYMFNVEEMKGVYIDTPNISELVISVSPNGETIIFMDGNVEFSKYIATISDGRIISPTPLSFDFPEKYGNIKDSYYSTMWSPNGKYFASAMDYKIDEVEHGSLFVFTDKAIFFKSLVDAEGLIVSLVDWQPCTNYILYEIGDLWQPGNKLIAVNPFTKDEVLVGYFSQGNWLLEIGR